MVRKKQIKYIPLIAAVLAVLLCSGLNLNAAAEISAACVTVESKDAPAGAYSVIVFCGEKDVIDNDLLPVSVEIQNGSVTLTQ